MKSGKVILLLAQLVILLYYLPYFILGEDAHVLIHDNLDSNIAWIKVLLNNNAVFAPPSKVIDQVLNGIPVYNVYGTYDVSLIVFKCFGVYFGYVINKLLISIIGFWGMFLLLRKHFFYFSSSQYIPVGISLIFSLLPFWSFSASVLGLPFVLFAFLNLRNKDIKYYNYLIIVLFAFYSSLVLSGIFLLFVLSLVFLNDVIRKRKINWPFFMGLALLSVVYLASHYPLIYGFLFDRIPSNRLESCKGAIGLKAAIHSSVDIFMRGQYHASSTHILFVIPVTVILLLWYKSFNKKVKLILAFIILTSLFYGFQNQYLIKPIIEQITGIVPLQLQRFHFLHPMFWYILLAVTLKWVSMKINNSKIIVFVILLIQLTYVIKQHELWVNRKQPTFKEFYSETTFNKIKSVIGKPIDSYRVISVGLHPAVAQFNGFETLDGYFPSYPLKYKHKFRKVIGNELARDQSLKNYFDNWGSRCYALSSEIGMEFVSNEKKTINYLDYDFRYLKNMGCEYIFSTASINESLNPKLQLIEVVNSPDDYWDIYLYKIK